MNKKLNTILFIAGATVFNILTTLLFLFLLGFIYLNFLVRFLPPEAQSWPFVIIFIGAIALSFIVYRIIIRILMSKVTIDKYFAPIFRGKHP